MNIEIIRSNLYKAYLEDFNAFCASIGGTTAEVMAEILKVRRSTPPPPSAPLDTAAATNVLTRQFEADRRCVTIALNSFGREITKDDRAKIYPSFGNLGPEGLMALGRADSADAVRTAVDFVGVRGGVIVGGAVDWGLLWGGGDGAGVPEHLVIHWEQHGGEVS
jgi:V-type H+-transporting ATPase subunit d